MIVAENEDAAIDEDTGDATDTAAENIARAGDGALECRRAGLGDRLSGAELSGRSSP